MRGVSDDLPKPALVRFFEAVAQVMELDERGLVVLELEFDDGHLRCWNVYDRRNGHEPLRQFDGRAAWLVPLVEHDAQVSPQLADKSQ